MGTLVGEAVSNSTVKSILEGKEHLNQQALVNLTRKGVPRSVVDDVARAFGLSMDQLCALLPISWRALRRYQPDQLLNSHVSDHLVCLIVLFARIVNVFGTPDKATRWVKISNPYLGYAPPMELLDTCAGMELVKDCLARIEHGVY
ncbi:antitoxin Xre/MbcA/ParS toxin-binding domain-containing protein [Geobacter argillaceus]|jgi:putative toxin-antitoxin system antitoxin component (TIGR02293 family)|uniref:antitoxin Xre/MbcA/ParS toxin-binding domain-containing protein n=1 Tax=Geobacter argillaceus TaxID=345631 RepID=UPI00119E0945|nr:antitoxin Xre/MbcA/ParS toxin-binding domain-containing protein [Geobacter argillaceus]